VSSLWITGADRLGRTHFQGHGRHTCRSEGTRAGSAEAVEQDHHGRPSFRVGGRIFATLWDDDRMNVMVDEDGVRTAVEDAPDICAPVLWGKRHAAVAVSLSAADEQFLAELLADAWEGKAPRRLLPDR
jgi:hypothetical protein